MVTKSARIAAQNKVWTDYDDLMQKLRETIATISKEEKLFALKLVMSKDDKAAISKIEKDIEKLQSILERIHKNIELLETHHKKLSQLSGATKLSAYNKAFRIFTEEIKRIYSSVTLVD